MAILRESMGMSLPKVRYGSALVQRRLRARQCLVRRTRRIDVRPAERAELIAFLITRYRGVGVRGVAAPTSYAGEPGIEIGNQKEPVKRNAERRCGFLYALALAGRREYRIDNGGVAGRECAARLVCDRAIDAQRHRGTVGLRRQRLGLGLAEQSLALDI